MFLITFAILMVNLEEPPAKNTYFSSKDSIHYSSDLRTGKPIVYNKVPTKMIKLNKKSN